MSPLRSVLFVCLGNICRSPLAEGIARSTADRYGINLRVDSCGISGYHVGSAPCRGSLEVAKRNGIDISSLVSRKISIYGDHSWDMLIAMDRQNKGDILRLGFDSSKVRLLGDYGVGKLNGVDVPDPYYYENDGDFDVVFDIIDRCLLSFFKIHFGIDR